MADGFLGRWARRKEAVRKGEEVAAEPPAEITAKPHVLQPAPAGRAEGGSDDAVAPVAPAAEVAPAEPPPPPPTLEDVESLTPASDFSRFVRPDVAPDVKNAAMKKLFADPHFNVMDRLDIYIDDYSKPDPLPPEMLRQLASAKFLKLFDEEEDEGEGEARDDATRHDDRAPSGKAPTGREAADVPPPESMAQLGTAEHIPAVPPAADHADPDLRLQQDDAPGPAGPGRRA